MRSYNRMSNLSYTDTERLEILFGAMHIRLNNRRNIINFFETDVGVYIDDIKYSGGKHRMGGIPIQEKFVEFLKKEDDHSVAQAIEAMINKIKSNPLPHEIPIINECQSIVARLCSSNPTTSDNLDVLNNKATIRNARDLVEEIRRIKQSIDTDPDPVQAIASAKNLIESVCKIILSEREKPVENSPKILPLVKDTLKELKLVPEGAYEEKSGSDAIKTLLNNLGSIGHNLGTLRNLYAGHGPGGTDNGLSARHAKLAAGAASTLALFLIETHEENKASTNQSAHQS